jgi:hypothetical protein
VTAGPAVEVEVHRALNDDRFVRGHLGGYVLVGHKDTSRKLYFRADAAFARPDVYEYFEENLILYAIRLKANNNLYRQIEHLMTRPVGRPPKKLRVFYHDFNYQAASWKKSRRVIAKVEWHQGELFPRVGFIVTNMSAKAKNVVRFYNRRGLCEQYIKEGKCPFLDQTVLHALLLKPGETGPVRTRVQPRQLPAPVRFAQGGVPLVASQRTDKARQDRCQGGKPLQEDDLPVRRGSGFLKPSSQRNGSENGTNCDRIGAMKGGYGEMSDIIVWPSVGRSI